MKNILFIMMQSQIKRFYKILYVLNTQDTEKNMELLINSLKIHQKYQYQNYLDKLEKLNKISSSSKTKYLPIDW